MSLSRATSGSPKDIVKVSVLGDFSLNSIPSLLYDHHIKQEERKRDLWSGNPEWIRYRSCRNQRSRRVLNLLSSASGTHRLTSGGCCLVLTGPSAHHSPDPHPVPAWRFPLGVSRPLSRVWTSACNTVYLSPKFTRTESGLSQYFERRDFRLIRFSESDNVFESRRSFCTCFGLTGRP